MIWNIQELYMLNIKLVSYILYPLVSSLLFFSSKTCLSFIFLFLIKKYDILKNITIHPNKYGTLEILKSSST